MINFFKETKIKINKHPMYTEILILIAVIAALSLAVYFYNAGQKKSEAQKYSIAQNKADELFYECKYKESINEYKKLLESGKTQAYFNMKIAEIYSVEGDFENSRKYIKIAKNYKDNSALILNYIMFTELMNKDYGSALSDGKIAFKAHPKDKQIIKTLFTVYMVNGNIDEAKDVISNYEVKNNSAYDVAEYARMLLTLGNWDEGLNELKSAWNVNKDEYKIYDVLAQVYTYNKDVLLQKITDLESKNKDDDCYKMWLTKLYSEDSDTADTADKLLKSINTKKSGNIEINLIKASILQNEGKDKEADNLIQSIIKKYPNDYRVLHTAGWYYLNKNEVDLADKYCRLSIIKNKDYPDNYSFLMPKILAKEGKSRDSEPYFRQAMYKEPYNYNIMLNIAEYYWSTEKSADKALEYFDFAGLLRPQDAEIKYKKAFIYISEKKDDEAVNILKDCIKIDDSIPKYHRTLGTIYLQSGKNDDAIKEIREAYSDDESDILNLNNAGCYYITFDSSTNIEKGVYNLQKAYEGINSSTDKYTKDTITDNYNKAKKLLSDYTNGTSNQQIKVPEFVFFY